MASSSPRRERGRTLVERDPDQLVWALAARDSKVNRRRDQERDGAKVDHQLDGLRSFVLGIGGRIDREVPEPNVSSFKRRKVELPDGTFGFRVVRPEWEMTMTALRRGECNALAVVDIDRATRDPRILEDLIDAVEMYGVYVVSMTGNIDLMTDSGITAARTLVNQRNNESRNTSRRVVDGKQTAASLGKHNGGRLRPFGWRKDRLQVNKRESAHIRREIPRIVEGVSCVTIAKEWNDRKVPTVTGAQWYASTVRAMFLNPRMCGKVVYRGEIMNDADGKPVRGRWEPVMTDDEYESVMRAWTAAPKEEQSRLEGKGSGYRTKHLLSPFLRCGKCNARMVGAHRVNKRTGERSGIYRCPAKGQGGCGGLARASGPVDAYIVALVIAEQKRIDAEKTDQAPTPWPREQELTEQLARIEESTRAYEDGVYSAEFYFPSLARMEAKLSELRRERNTHARGEDAKRNAFADIEQEWEKPGFTLELKQAAIGKSLTAVVVAPAGGARFHPDQLQPVFKAA